MNNCKATPNKMSRRRKCSANDVRSMTLSFSAKLATFTFAMAVTQLSTH